MVAFSFLAKNASRNNVTCNDIPARGRGRPRVHESDAARVQAHREKHDLVALTVDLPRAVVDEFNEYLKFKDVTKNAVIEKLLRSQLLRKR